MNKSTVRWLVMALVSLVVGLITAQWVGGNISVQIGGSNNHVEQKIDYTSQAGKKPISQ